MTPRSAFRGTLCAVLAGGCLAQAAPSGMAAQSTSAIDPAAMQAAERMGGRRRPGAAV